MKVSEFFTRTQFPVSNSCFVLMPFEEGMSAVYEHGIKPLVESLGMQCRRGDEMYSTQGILSDIWQSIQTAEVIIADLTGKNPNVMYELGLSHSLWKRVILLSQNKDDVPFDLRAWRVIWYDFTFAGAARLKEELSRAITALRAEDATESEPKPVVVPKRVVAAPPPAAQAVEQHPESDGPAWRFGAVNTWKNEQGYGFIRSEDVDYYAHVSSFFLADIDPEPDREVLFQLGPPSSPGKAPRATVSFIFGSKIRGHITRLRSDKGFGFADFYDRHNNIINLFILTHSDSSVKVGDHIEAELWSNQSGPIGRNVHVVPSGTGSDTSAEA